MEPHRLAGVFTAALTPLNQDFTPAPGELPQLLSFYATRGCHGALVLGTTGEGPSFSPQERIPIFEAAVQVRQEHPNFRLLAGTGTPSLTETQSLTKAAFDLGFDGAVVLPPYYFRSASDEGLFEWFKALIKRSVPKGGALLGYHIPAISGVPFSFNLISRLLDAFPGRFVGLKDSSGDPEHAQHLGEQFGEELAVFGGNDRLFSLALGNQASGSITALANLCSPDLRSVWDAFQAGDDPSPAQIRLDKARQVLDKYPPFAPTLKAMLSHFHGFPSWPVRPPLELLPDKIAIQAISEMGSALA